MAVKNLLIPLIIIQSCTQLFSQTFSTAQDQVMANFEKVTPIPKRITFQNTLEINNKGGHLQGIQLLNYKQKEYYVVSGSSETYSYYSIVKVGKENIVISINKILEAPFKHAGGFQIWENLMAIGVEDNAAKNKSKVFIFDIDNPERPPKEPLAVIDRFGTFKRATAGCVGIVEITNKVVVVVGDWDTEHLDFYRIDRERLFEEGPTLELEYSINTKNMDKSGWIDKSWLSYQNINLIKSENNTLYLAGLTANQLGEDILDLFIIESVDLSTFKLQKIYTRTFAKNDLTTFRWGAGIAVKEHQHISILSSCENIQHESAIQIYE